MKTVVAATALAIFGVVPVVGSACEYMDESSASAAPPAQFASAAPVAASKAPARTVQVLAPKAVKPVADKTKPADQKVSVVTNN
ncbi:MAG TPA: hypothetical protein VH704_10075 [Casimicrobiaceae bacterium]|jgi:hypothetical protein|nr:hypothetical protein [Casimicrobiaceae bacterium]